MVRTPSEDDKKVRSASPPGAAAEGESNPHFKKHLTSAVKSPSTGATSKRLTMKERRISFESKDGKLDDGPSNTNLTEEEIQRQKSIKRTQSKKLHNAVTCRVCMKPYTNPKTLPCEHTFCSACLEKFVNPKNLVSCYICHKEFPAAKGDVTEFATNPTIQKLLERVRTNRANKLQQQQQQQQQQQNKEEGAATSEVEPRRSSRDAITTHLAAAASTSASSGEVRSCCVCNLPLNDVGGKGESGHFCSLSKKYYCTLCFDKHAKVIQENVSGLKDRLETSEAKIKQMDKESEEKTKHLDALADEILKERIEVLKSEREGLRSALTNHRSATKTKLDSLGKEVERLRGAAEEASGMGKQEMISHYADVHSGFVALLKELDDQRSIQVQLSGEVIPQEESPFRLVETRISLQHPEAQNVPNLLADHKKANPGILTGSVSSPKFALTAKVKLSNQRKASCAAHCPWTGEVFVCVPDLKCLEVYDTSGRHRRTISSGDDSGANLLYPYRIAFVQKSKEAFVLDKWKNCVMLMDPSSGIFSTSFSGKGEQIGKLLNPCGLCCDASGEHVYVADTGNHRIQVFNKTGKFIRLMGANFHKGQNGEPDYSSECELDQPEDVAISADGNTVAVADTGNNRVRLYTKHGQRLSVIGMRGRGNGQFQLPLTVDIHPCGLLLAGDADNNRIQVFTLAGQFVRSVYGYRKVCSLRSTTLETNQHHQHHHQHHQHHQHPGKMVLLVVEGVSSSLAVLQ